MVALKEGRVGLVRSGRYCLKRGELYVSKRVELGIPLLNTKCRRR